MTLSAADAARFSVRPLLPGPEDALRAEVLRLGAGIERLAALATHGAAEALALRGLEPDQARVLEREARRLGLAVLSDAAGRRAVVLGSLQAVAELPSRLVDFGQRTAGLGQAIAACLAGKGARPWGLVAGPHRLPSGSRTLVMGVVNVTPDSFSGDGVGEDLEAAVARGMAMAGAGADIIDVGGESTRPHSTPVPEAEELDRVIPVIRALVAQQALPVSVDTRKATVAAAAVAAGATVVNDVWGLRADPAMAEVCAAHEVGVVVMHNQRGTEYVDLMEAVAQALRESLAVAERWGIDSERIAIDPGFGFGKTPAHNLELVRRLGELRGLGRPILVGPSRKSTIGLVLAGGGPPAPVPERLEGTLALNVLAVAAGADLLRVHDVPETVRALRLADAVARGTPPQLLTTPAPGPTG
ncbi:MAG TPA: dihydropteroate synthase [Candidatus Dormibacteraeota bacterium]